MSKEFSELNRRFQNVALIGTISEVDYPKATCKVRVGDLETGWIPMPADIGRNYRRWRPLEPGIQVALICPSGDLVNALITGILYSDTFPQPNTSPDQDVTLFDDGALFRYDIKNHIYDVILPSSGTINFVVGKSRLTITDGNVTIKTPGFDGVQA